MLYTNNCEEELALLQLSVPAPKHSNTISGELLTLKSYNMLKRLLMSGQK